MTRSLEGVAVPQSHDADAPRRRQPSDREGLRWRPVQALGILARKSIPELPGAKSAAPFIRAFHW